MPSKKEKGVINDIKLLPPAPPSPSFPCTYIRYSLQGVEKKIMKKNKRKYDEMKKCHQREKQK